MRTKIILLVFGLAVITLSLAGNADAALPEQQPKGAAVFHSLADGDVILTDTTGLVCTWWRQLWKCRNKYHIIDYKDNNDGKISACDYIKTEMTEAFGLPVSPPWVQWFHIERVTITLELMDDPVSPQDTMYVEFSGGIDPDSIARVRTNPVSTWWHEVYPQECVWWHIDDWQDNGSGELDSCDYIIITRTKVYHVVVVQVGTADLSLKLEGEEGHFDSMRVVFSGGLDPDSVDRALHAPVCTWWHEIRPDSCTWWHIVDWQDNGNAELDSCDTIIITTTEIWHVEDVATDIEVVTSDPPPEGAIPTTTQWGLVILVVLLLASAVFIFLRRKKIMVSP